MACGLSYSFRSASTGSSPAARRAGITAARNAASPNSTVAAVSIVGPHGRTPYSWPAIARPARIAAGIPSASPIAYLQEGPTSTIRTTLPRSAPNAMRTPISLVRCSTV